MTVLHVRILFTGVFALLLLRGEVSSEGQPVNDNFVNRTPLVGAVCHADGDFTGATLEPGEPQFGGDRSLWWTWTAPQTGAAWLYRGETLNSLLLIKNQFGGAMSLAVQAGETLQVRVAAPNLLVNPISFAIQTLSSPANDRFENSTRLEGASVSATGRTLGASLEPGEPPVAPECPGRTVWFSWVAPETSRVASRLTSPELGAVLSFAVYTGPSIDRLTKAIRTLYGYKDFLAVKDTVYHIQVDGALAEDFELSLTAVPLPCAANDNFSSAIELKGPAFALTASMVGASVEEGEPAHLGSIPAKSVWWKWEAPFNGRYHFSTWNSLVVDPTLAIYTGSSLDTLTLVTAGPGGVALDARGGQVYYLAGVVPESSVGDIGIDLGGGFPNLTSFAVPGNLVQNPSFEIFNGGGWQFNYCGGTFNEEGAADGACWVTVGGQGSCWQDIPTVAGREYEIRLAFGTYRFSPGVPIDMRVWWGDVQLTDLRIEDPWNRHWNWATLRGSATTSTTRLKFENLGVAADLDAVSVVWLNEPPSLVVQPQSLSTFAGGSVTFFAGARGTEPLAYQWFFNGQSLAGATGRSLSIEPVAPANAGSYYAVVSNPFGVVATATVSLTVLTPTMPAIVLQPFAEEVPIGSYVALSVAAVGTPPLSYQWLRDGEEIPEATDRQLVFPSVQSSDAGRYTVTVRNYSGSDTSLPAKLTTQEPTGTGCLIWFRTWDPFAPGVNAPIFDVGGYTKLAGPEFVAQIYAGPSLESLRPCGQPSAFQSGFSAGEVVHAQVPIPHVEPNALAYVEVRAWQRSYGASYEEARALGGKHGKSATLYAEANATYLLLGLQSFSLKAGLSQFHVGELQIAERHPDGTTTWELRGEAGARYVIEKADGEMNWKPFQLLRNETGTVTFVDSTEGEHDNEFYRARLLD